MKIKKILLFIVAMLACLVSYAASPNLSSITLKNSNGETLDFYPERSNGVVYKASGASNSRMGTYYIGSIISSANGNVEAKFSIEVPMSYGTKKLSGTIYYRNSDGYVYYVTLDGNRFSSSSSSRAVVPRRR